MGNNLRIRGLNSRYILFLVDGERLVGEGAGGNINLDQIDIANIKRIEMINGAASVLYGSNAVGAVINVITKEPQEAIAAGCDISYQSNNTAKTRVHVKSRQNKFLSQASIYRNDIKDKITQYEVVNELGGLEKYYKNTSSATITGLDINFSAIIFRHLYLKGSYSLCDATDNATGEQLSGNVKHSGTASATWNGNFLKGQYSVQIAGRFSSPHSYSSSGKTSLSKPYNIWKAVITKRFHLGKNDLNLTLKCDNLFNFQDPTFINPGRQYLIGLNYKFN